MNDYFAVIKLKHHCVTYNDDVSMYWCEISLTENDLKDQVKITD